MRLRIAVSALAAAVAAVAAAAAAHGNVVGIILPILRGVAL
jgi:hypothetical protein